MAAAYDSCGDAEREFDRDRGAFPLVGTARPVERPESGASASVVNVNGCRSVANEDRHIERDAFDRKGRRPTFCVHPTYRSRGVRRIQAEL
jgi:hypothetical protein